MTFPEPTQPAYAAPSPTGFRDRLGVPMWVAALALGAVVLSGVAGWALAMLLSSQREPLDQSQTVEQARTQACNAFRVAGRQWVDAYRQWLPVVSETDWRWGDPDVQAATLKFSAVEGEVAAQLNTLISPNTPIDVAQAIRGYTRALLEFSAGHFEADEATMAQQETEINDAADEVSRVCAAK